MQMAFRTHLDERHDDGQSDLLEEISESAAYVRGCVIYGRHSVLTVLMSEDAESGALNERVRPPRIQTRYMLTSNHHCRIAQSIIVDPPQQRPKATAASRLQMDTTP